MRCKRTTQIITSSDRTTEVYDRNDIMVRSEPDMFSLSETYTVEEELKPTHHHRSVVCTNDTADGLECN